MKFKICILAVLHMCFLKTNAQNLYDKAYNEYMNGDLSKSVEMFNECIRNREDTLHAYLYQAGANMLLGRYKDAMNGLTIVNQINPTEYKLHFYFGNLYLFLNDNNKAIENYDAELARYPNEVNVYQKRAIAKGVSGDYEGAFADYAKSIEMDSNFAEAYSNRGHLLMTLKRYDEAINDLKKSIQITPSEIAFANLGLVHYLTDSNKLAIDDFTNALKLDPNDAESIYVRAVSYNKINMINEACADFKRSLSLGYKDAQEMIDESHCN